MKTIIKIGLSTLLVLVMSGCVTKTHTIYVNPEYPELPTINKVANTNNTFILDGCLHINEKNSNLCDDDLSLVLGQIKKLRINEKTCIKANDTYNKWVADQNATEDTTETEFGISFF